MIKFICREDHLPEESILKYLKYDQEEAFGQGKPGLTETNVTVLARKHQHFSSNFTAVSIWNHFYHSS